jgi:hypothetical protein
MGMDSSGSSLSDDSPGWFFRQAIGGTATNCYNKGPIGVSCGGIFGNNSSGKAINCYNTGAVDINAGGIFGCFSSGTATNCFNTGNIGINGGGMVGGNSSIIATNCYNTGTIDEHAGGICGHFCRGTATACYNTGAIGLSAGGIYGYEALGKVINCYNTGAIGSRAGGIMGANSTGDNTVTNCYNTGSIGDSGGGIIGAEAKGTITNCYNAGAIGAGAGVGGVVGDKPHSDIIILVKSGSSIGWSDGAATQYLTGFPIMNPGNGSIWTGIGAGIPFVLKNNTPPTTTTTTTRPPTTTTTTTTKQPTTTMTVNMLVNLDESFDGILMKNTTYNLTRNLNLITGFSCSVTSDSNIVFNGNGFVITAIGNTSWPGLFPCDVSVNNMGMDSASSRLSADGAGWFFGPSIGGTATNCYNRGPIGVSCGGIFGNNSSGKAINCYNSGAIGNSGGGIFGSNAFGTATSCYNTGAIDINAGGIFGSESNGTATNCYNTGTIGVSAGGIFGYLCGRGTATTCYNTGAIGSNAGGIMGDRATGNGAVTNCYNMGNISDGGGGIVGSAGTGPTPITNCYNAGAIGDNGGGILGSRAKGKITNCYNSGTIGVNAGGIVGRYPDNMTSITNCGSTSGWIDANACQFLTDFPSTIPGSGRIWISLAASQPFVLSNNTPPTTTTTTTQPPTTTTTTTTTRPTTTTTTTAYPWPPVAVVQLNGADMLPLYTTATKAYFRILATGCIVSSKLDCTGVLVSIGNDSPDPASNPSNPGGNSGGMIPITLNANISYFLKLDTNASIENLTTHTTITTEYNNVAFGGTNGSKGADNIFGRGKGGDIVYGGGPVFGGSGYGAGGGGGSGYSTIWPSGGGGGFDPNLYYGLTASISGVPVSDQVTKKLGNGYVGVGKPGVLFLELTKP